INRALAYAAAVPIQTGAYVAVPNYYSAASPDAPAPVLNAFAPGGFLVTHQNLNIVHIDPAVAGPTGLSDSTLTGWQNTTHAWLSRYPSDFKVWAISQVPAGTDGTVNTSDGARGFPSFLVRSGAPTCTVPKLKGKTLKKAKNKLRKRSCKLGKVKGHGTNV